MKRMYHRYKRAPGPGKGKRHSVAYRMRMLVDPVVVSWETVDVVSTAVETWMGTETKPGEAAFGIGLGLGFQGERLIPATELAEGFTQKGGRTFRNSKGNGPVLFLGTGFRNWGRSRGPWAILRNSFGGRGKVAVPAPLWERGKRGPLGIQGKTPFGRVFPPAEKFPLFPDVPPWENGGPTRERNSPGRIQTGEIRAQKGGALTQGAEKGPPFPNLWAGPGPLSLFPREYILGSGGWVKKRRLGRQETPQRARERAHSKASRAVGVGPGVSSQANPGPPWFGDLTTRDSPGSQGGFRGKLGGKQRAGWAQPE